MQDRVFTDEELVAFLDGEDDLAPVDAIAAALAQDAALARRVDALRIDQPAIADSFAQLRPAEGVMPDLDALDTAPAGFSLRACAAAAIVALAIGVGAGQLMSGQSRDGWAEYVAAYQALYSTSTLAHLDPAPADQKVELARVTAAIGKDIPLEALTAFPEADYKRAQVLSFEGRALIQLAFVSSTGAPLALCIIRGGEAEDAASPKLRTMEGLSTAQWAQGGYQFMLIGGMDDALVARLADGFAAQAL